MNIQDLKDVVEKVEKDEQERIGQPKTLVDDYAFYGEHYTWLLDMVKRYIDDNMEYVTVDKIDNTIRLKLTYHELSNLLDLIEYGLIQKGLDSVEDDTKTLYYSLINTWGEHSEVQTEQHTTF